MRVADVRKRYPEFFVTVEAAAWDDMQMDFKRGIISDTKVMRRIAYNAAAVATLELHKIASRKKIIVAGKTSHNSAMVEIADSVCSFYTTNPRLNQSDVSFLVQLETRLRQ